MSPSIWQRRNRLSLDNPQKSGARFEKSPAPPRFREFLRLALWRKLPVGARLNSWLNDGGLCPFHQELETVPHALSECLFLGVAISFVNLVFPEVSVCVLSRTEESLSHPAGLLVWTVQAIHAHWQSCSIVKRDPPTNPVPLNRFLHLWCSSISDWADPPSCSLRLPLIRGFQRGINSFIKQGRFVFSPIEALRSPEKRKKKATAQAGLKLNWMTLLEEAVTKINQFTSQGWRVVFTDGSAVLEDDLGWVGGFGLD